MPRNRRIAAFIKKIGGSDFRNPYKFKLRPAEIVLMEALEKYNSIDVNKMTGLELNSIRVQISRLRKKLPEDVTIDTIYGGLYHLPEDARVALKKYKRVAT